jgi:hypothetical protein
MVADGVLTGGALTGGVLIEGVLIEGVLIEGVLIEGVLIEGVLIEGTLTESVLTECGMIDATAALGDAAATNSGSNIGLNAPPETSNSDLTWRAVDSKRVRNARSGVTSVARGAT